MNKAHRFELKMKHYKRRLKMLGLKEGPKMDLYCYRTTGKPCSCEMCSPHKYKRKNKEAIKHELQQYE